MWRRATETLGPASGPDAANAPLFPEAAFHDAHFEEYGHRFKNGTVEVINIRVEASAVMDDLPTPAATRYAATPYAYVATAWSVRPILSYVTARFTAAMERLMRGRSSCSHSRLNTSAASANLPSLLYTPAGKPRVAVLSIAHLGDAERMFFVSLLLNQVVGWMRTQAGTTSLRAIVYMDVFEMSNGIAWLVNRYVPDIQTFGDVDQRSLEQLE